MTFPVYESVARYYGVSGNTHSLTLPSGIVAGDLLVAVVGNDNTTLASFSENGWRQIATGLSNGTTDAVRVFLKRATGSEGATTSYFLNVTEAVVSHIYRISGADRDAEAAVLEGTLATLTATMPSLSPSWGAEDVLWIEAVVAVGMTGITSMSSGYSAGIYDGGIAASAVALISAYRTANAATESPGTIVVTGSTNANCVSVLIGIRATLVGGGSVIVIEEE